MDLFDLGAYFAYVVPVRARSHPLLRHAACALAAKQLGRAKGAKAIVGGICSQQSSMEMYDGASIDWEWEGAYQYDRSIALLMETMQQDQDERSPASRDHEQLHWRDSRSTAHTGSDLRDRQGLHDRATAPLRSDEVVAATAILCVYEFLSATGAAWSRHLNGTKSLFDFAEGSMMSLEMPTFNPSVHAPRPKPSRARLATFWNFARQDYLAACEYRCFDCHVDAKG